MMPDLRKNQKQTKNGRIGIHLLLLICLCVPFSCFLYCMGLFAEVLCVCKLMGFVIYKTIYELYFYRKPSCQLISQFYVSSCTSFGTVCI